jgi:hypothetical protein
LSTSIWKFLSILNLYILSVIVFINDIDVLTVPGVGLTPTEAPDKDHLSRALHLAKRSTASLGKFTKELPKEKPVKNMGKKRKVI